MFSYLNFKRIFTRKQGWTGILPYVRRAYGAALRARMGVRYEMVVANEARSAEFTIIISYPTSASGIIVLLKTPTKYREFFPTIFVKTTDFHLVFNFDQTRKVTKFGEHGIIALSKIQLVVYYQCCVLIG